MSSPSDSKPNRRKLGAQYESAAADYLISQGYTILDRNWQAGHKEIDLIARKDNLVVFVEVKASRTGSFGHPIERVDRTKQQNLLAAAQQYIQDPKLAGCDFRLDVITFFEGKLEHFPDAFQGE